MKKLQIQFELPCPNPVDNVRMKRGKTVITIYVPNNFPDLHTLSLCELLKMAQDAELLELSGTHNRERKLVPEVTLSSKVCVNKNTLTTQDTGVTV